MLKLAALALLALATTHVGAQERQTVVFETTQATTFGDSIYVLGDLPELGANEVTRAVKLEPTNYPVWRARVSLPANRTYTYRFYRRNDSAGQMRVATNGTPLTNPVTATTATANLSPTAKSIVYHTAWASPVVWWRQGSGAYQGAPMVDISPGRNAGERRWLARGLGLARQPIEFYITPGTATSTDRDPSAAVGTGTYITSLDAAFLQDGQLYNYVPAPSVSAGVRAYSASSLPFIDSTNLGERRYHRVWLPRGYNQHTSRSYPVLYMHDGQNIFEPGPFGTWSADAAAAEQVRLGNLREVIIVGADSNANRFRNYVPPGDITPDAQPGAADAYLRYVRDELKPWVQARYRTLNDAANTGTMGSSMGGQVSLYFGWDFASTFSRVGALSNYWSTNFRNRVHTTAKPPIRVYLDSGDSGTASDNFTPTFGTRDAMITPNRPGTPFALEDDLRHFVGFFQQHNEAAWASRCGAAMAFLFPTREEANPLLVLSGSAHFDFDGLRTTVVPDLDDAYALSAGIAGTPGAPPFVGVPRDVNLDGATNASDARAIVSLARAGERASLVAGR
jgi:predicted alpha/beta superfamily hydrolase